MTIFRIFVVIVFSILFSVVNAGAQSLDGISATWKPHGSTSLIDAIQKQQSQRTVNHSANLAIVQFKPTGDRTVAKTLADAFGGTEEEKAGLTQLFQQIQEAYDSEVAKEGKSNNLAAAFTFFIAGNIMAYQQTIEPSEKATESLFNQLQDAIVSVPEFAQMSNLEKENMSDWLVCMGGFAMSGFAQAKQSGDQKGMETYQQLADYSLRLVLGIEASKLNFHADEFVLETETASQPSGNTDKSLVGTWSKSASSPWGLDPGTVMTNTGYYKGQYQFKADGNYTFKGESWGGTMRSNEFWTIEENGTYVIRGNTVTISASASKATLRNREGVVQKSQTNQLEKVSYKWKMHYFEGIQETNLVLQPDRPTMRDGGFSSNSEFLNSYLYSQNGNLEWRF